MPAFSDKIQKDRQQTASTSGADRQNKKTSTFQLKDNRPQSIQLMKMQELVDESNQVKQLQGIQQLAHAGHRVLYPATHQLQRKQLPSSASAVIQAHTFNTLSDEQMGLTTDTDTNPGDKFRRSSDTYIYEKGKKLGTLSHQEILGKAVEGAKQMIRDARMNIASIRANFGRFQIEKELNIYRKSFRELEKERRTGQIDGREYHTASRALYEQIEAAERRLQAGTTTMESKLGKHARNLFQQFFGDFEQKSVDYSFTLRALDWVESVFINAEQVLHHGNVSFNEINAERDIRASASTKFEEYNISIYPYFFTKSAPVRAATIVHELTHMIADTNDPPAVEQGKVPGWIDDAKARAMQPYKQGEVQHHAVNTSYNFEWFAAKSWAARKGLARQQGDHEALYETPVPAPEAKEVQHLQVLHAQSMDY